MTNIEVVENWNSGYAGNAEHLFTDGRTIWSYGRHFPIVTRNNGRICYNEDAYSITTSRHQGHVARILGWSTKKELIKAVKAGVSKIVLLNTIQLKAIVD